MCAMLRVPGALTLEVTCTRKLGRIFKHLCTEIIEPSGIFTSWWKFKISINSSYLNGSQITVYTGTREIDPCTAAQQSVAN